LLPGRRDCVAACGGSAHADDAGWCVRGVDLLELLGPKSAGSTQPLAELSLEAGKIGDAGTLRGELGSESLIGFALFLRLDGQVVGLSCESVDFDEKLRLPQCSLFDCRGKKGSDATAGTETNEKGGDFPIGQTHPLPQQKAGSYEMATGIARPTFFNPLASSPTR
jgi:hypothetical protein